MIDETNLSADTLRRMLEQSRELAYWRGRKLETATANLEEIHRLLYPEEWMTEAEKADAIESGFLNAEGIREWDSAAEFLEEINIIVGAAVIRRTIQPTPKGDTPA